MSTFRDDGAAALDWAARYLERVGELPGARAGRAGRDPRGAAGVAARAGGAVRAPCSRDLDELLLPGSRTGSTRASSPTSRRPAPSRGSSPSCSIADAQPGRRSSGARRRRSTELEERDARLAAAAARPARAAGTATSRTRRRSRRSRRSSRRARRRPTARVVVCSEHAHSSIEKAARLLGLELRHDAGRRRLPHATPTRSTSTDACAVVATVGTTSSTVGRSRCRRSPTRAAAAGAWLHVDAAYAGSAAVCPELRGRFAGLRARRLARRQPAQVAVHADGLLASSGRAARRPPRGVQPRARVPARRREDVVSLSEYGPPLGRRFRALKLWAVLRCFGREGLQAIIREHVRLAELFERLGRATSRAGSSARRGRSRSSASAATAATRRTRRCWSASTRAARSSSRTRSSTAATCCGSRSATRARRRTTSRSPGTCCARRPRQARLAIGAATGWVGASALDELRHHLGVAADLGRARVARARAARRASPACR